MSNPNPRPNLERLTQLRDHLASLPPSRFDMTQWFSSYRNITLKEFAEDCGTCACIGGWADTLFRSSENRLTDTSIYDPVDGTYALLGLTEEQGEQLCFPSSAEGSGWPEGDDVTYRDVTTADAVLTLTKLIETGKVDWSHVHQQN